MKVKTESGRCDFCQIEEAKYTINGGLWWICEKCMIFEYDVGTERIGGEEE